MSPTTKKILGAVLCLGIVALGVYFIIPRKPESRMAAVPTRLKWLHQAQFAGFYVAEKKGFYAAEDLSPSLRPGGVEFPAVESVVSGAEKFGVTSADQVLLQRAQGAPIVAVAVIYRATPMVLFSFAQSNIRTAADLSGKRVGVKLGGNEELTYRAILRAANVDASKIHEIPVKYDMTPLFEGLVDVWPGYLINEVLVAKEKGRQVNVINPKDYGLDIYADTLFTTEDEIRKEPDVVQRYVAATLRGWQYAFDHPEEAARFGLEYDPKLNYDHELAMMKESLPLLKPDAQPVGSMESEKWERLANLLKEYGFLKQQIDVSKAFDPRFVQAFYENRK
ncbi:MAG TPA: ABC transporter substrate-binding protein [Pyrinomonadaceae bacterium]|jgi:ABC-type nitrate/sulfonate/bicarbonate transport system substrate-binding protein|nr:ABC transporter substrate-binding protein [Pyrinomonadaceae bacterium]